MAEEVVREPYGYDVLLDVGRLPRGIDAEGHSGLQELADRLCREIDQAIIERRNFQPRWDRLKGYYYNQTPPAPQKPSKRNASRDHINVIQTKVDALRTYVVDTILSQEPYCTATSLVDPEGAALITKVVQSFFDRAKYPRYLRRIGVPAAWSNRAVLCIKWPTDGLARDGLPGFKIEAAQPEQFVVYPSDFEDLEDAKLSGVLRWRREAEIDEMRMTGEYLKGPNVRIESPPSQTRAEEFPTIQPQTISSAVEPEDSLIPIYQVVFKAPDRDGRERLWHATVAKDSRVLLKLGEYDYSMPYFAVHGYKPDSDGFWSQSSVADDLQDAQIAADNLIRKQMDGIDMNVFGAIIAAALKMPEQFKTFGAGDIVEIAAPKDGIQTYNPRADLNSIPPTMEFVMTHADNIARISSAGAGGQSNFKTATEATISNAGQQRGIDDYISTFGEGVEQAYRIALELLRKHWPTWFPVLGESLGMEMDDVKRFVETKVEWNLTVSSVGGTPGSQLQYAMSLMELAGAHPESMIDKYELAKRILEVAERLGVTNAVGLQLDRDPQVRMAELAQSLGVPPEFVMAALQQFAGQMEAMNGQTSLDGSAGNPGVQGQLALPSGSGEGATGIGVGG